jgi:hypothetical protein
MEIFYSSEMLRITSSEQNDFSYNYTYKVSIING